MREAILEFGSKARLLLLKDNTIIHLRGFSAKETLLDELYKELAPIGLDKLTVVMKAQYVSDPSGSFLVDKITTHDGRKKFGVIAADELKAVQELARAIGLKRFYVCTNADLYKTVVKRPSVILDEFGVGTFVVVPFNKTIVDYKVATDVAVEEVAKLYLPVIGGKELVNMLDTDLASLEFESRFKNYSELPVGVKRSITQLCAAKDFSSAISLGTNDKIDLEDGVLEELPEQVFEDATVVEKPKKEVKKLGMAEKVMTFLLCLLIVLNCLSFVVNKKIDEDNALIQQAVNNIQVNMTGFMNREKYLGYVESVKEGQAPSVSELYGKLSGIVPNTSLVSLALRPTHFEFIFLVGFEEDIKMLNEELSAVLSVQQTNVEALTQEGVPLYKVVYTHDLSDPLNPIQMATTTQEG